MRRMNILSIQSWVAYGHVGNSSAVFPLQRLGAEVWAVNTVQFSNHTGYGDWTDRVATGPEIAALIDGIAARGVLPACDAVLSGYIGSGEIGEAIAGGVRRVKAANPAAIYCCDPVLGDDGALYVRPGVPEFIREVALPLADIATPNQFELRHLTGLPCDTLASAKAAISLIQGWGPRIVLVTSLDLADTPADRIDMLVGVGGRFHRLRTPRLPITVNGAGDAIAALFLFHCLSLADPVAAMERAGSSTHGLLRRTHEAGSREILTVAAQEEFVAPRDHFLATAC